MFASKLLIGVHSNSIEEALKNDKQVVDIFFECAKMKECLVLALPVADASLLSNFGPNAIFVTYKDRGDGSFLAEHSGGSTGFHDSIPPSKITDIYGCKEDSTEFKEIKGAFLDLLAFEAISRWHKNESLFVSQAPYLLEKQVWRARISSRLADKKRTRQNMKELEGFTEVPVKS